MFLRTKYCIFTYEIKYVILDLAVPIYLLHTLYDISSVNDNLTRW